MSDILIVVPSDWTAVDAEAVNAETGRPLSYFQGMQGGSMNDINEHFANINWFANNGFDGLIIQDVLVLGENLYFKFEVIPE